MSLEVVSGCHSECSHQYIHTTVNQAFESMSPKRWNVTQKLDPTLDPSNYNYDMSTTFCKRWTWTFAHMFYMFVLPETLLHPGGTTVFRSSFIFLLYFVYLFTCCLYDVFLDFHFLSVYRGCWRIYVVPVIAQRTTSNGMTLYYMYLLLLSTPLLPMSTTELVSPGRISADTGCAGCRRVERTV